MKNSISTGFISLKKAIEMTKRYRANKNTVINQAYAGKEILATCDTFNKSAVATLLSKPECASIRLYYGMNEELHLRPILVAVNEKGEDILPDLATLDGDDPSEDIVDDSMRCPPLCPPASPLNI